MPNLAPQSRVAFSSIALNTGSSSPRWSSEITLSTSEVAVCCSRRLAQIVRPLAQLVEEARVLDGDDGLRSEVRHQLDLLVGERDRIAVRSSNRADGFAAWIIGAIIIEL